MKIGQKIKCINSNDSESLNRGSTYEVVDINQYNNIQVKPLNGEPLQHYYKPARFELVTDTQKAPKTIDLSKKYKTRGGQEVKLFAISDDPTYPVVGQILENDGWKNEQWTSEGTYVNDGESCTDLVEVIKEIVLDFSDRNLHLKIRDDLVVEVLNWRKERVATLVPEVMEELIEAYNHLKQCKN